MISIKDLGGLTAVARMTGLSVPTIHGWKTIPAQHCPAIERATNGKYSCEALRQDLSWKRIPDSEWPHLNGRPLLDFVASKDSAQEQPIGPATIAPVATESIAKPIATKASEPAPTDLKPRVAPRRHDEKPSPYAHTDIDRRESDGLTESERRAKAQAAAEAAKARGEA